MCGVFGIYAPEHDVARLTYFALYALQHRGQESAGIASANGTVIALRDMGLVSQVFNEQKLRALNGDMAIGHVRYSTTGATTWENSQPVYRSDNQELALAHNGNITNMEEIRKELSTDFMSSSDSEVITAMISHDDDIENSVKNVMEKVKGAYSITAIINGKLVAFRDAQGFRPLVLGMIEDQYCVASESAAFDIIGAKTLRDVLPGELLIIDDKGIHTKQVLPNETNSSCVFEHIYFARPDSKLDGKRVQTSRSRMGEILYQEAPVDADLVIAVPDSGNSAARGYARASGIPQEDGFVKNRYVARTFIQPGQELRKLGLRMKFNPLPDVVAGKRLVVVDDSIVRGNTTRQIVQMLKDAGALEVHMRISAPPIRHGCYWGIDMADPAQMVAHNKEVSEIRDELGCDSLEYLSLDGVYEAIRSRPTLHCDACFTGNRP